MTVANIISNISDNTVRCSNPTGAAGWSNLRKDSDSTDCTLGVVSAATDSLGLSLIQKFSVINILRSFFQFNLSGIANTNTVSAASFTFYATSTGASIQTSVQKGYQHNPVTTADYYNIAYVPTTPAGAYGFSTNSVGSNTITFNAAGISDVQSALGGTFSMCGREYNYDYLGTQIPGTIATYATTIQMADGVVFAKPTLNITYSAGGPSYTLANFLPILSPRG